MTYTTWYLDNRYWYLLAMYLLRLWLTRPALGFLVRDLLRIVLTPASYKDDTLTRCHRVHCSSERISIQLSIEEVLTTQAHYLVSDRYPDTALSQVR